MAEQVEHYSEGKQSAGMVGCMAEKKEGTGVGDASEDGGTSEE